MTDKEYDKGFNDALEFVLEIYNRSASGKCQKCQKCQFVSTVGELLLKVKAKYLELLSREIGHNLDES
jgi:hypothetical protein